MPRRVQDIIPASRRSIREIPVKKINIEVIEERPKEELKKNVQDNTEKESYKRNIEDSKNIEKPRKKKKNSKLPFVLAVIGIVIIIAGIAFGFSGHFAKATFILVPKVVPVSVSGTYIIPMASSTAFGYSTVTLTDKATTTIPATIGSYTETKAQGSVTVYNSYSAQSQKLVAGSRIVAGSGLVYRLNNSVVVPGYKLSGKITVPGSVVTTIVAEKAGDQYNISGNDSVSDLKFITYKGTAKYDGFYARLAGNITGGFAGTKMVVSPSLLASTTAQVQSNLVKTLQSRMFNTIPAGFVMYPNIFASTFANPVVTTVDSKTAGVSVSATVYGVLFKKIDFAKFLAGSSSTAMFGTIGYNTNDIDSLSVIMANQSDFSPAKKTNLLARINGSFTLSGSIPVTTLQQSFAGSSISKTAEILKKYASVIDLVHSSVEINPPWVSTVPVDQNRITIVVPNK